MSDLTLKRGGRDVTFSKLPSRFGVRLKRGRARDERALEAACGRSQAPVRHLSSVPSGRLDLFAVDTPAQIEQVTDALRVSPATEVVTHVYSLDDKEDRGVVIPVGTLTVQFRPDASDDERTAVLAEFGLEVVEALDYLPGGYGVRLTAASKENPLKIARKLQASGAVLIAEPDLAFQARLEAGVSDPLFADQWHLQNLGDAVGLKAGADVRAPGAWDFTKGAREVTICVIDDGFDLSHGDLGAPGKIVAPRDFGQDDNVPEPVASDDNHGTACAGVALAEENGRGGVGLAPRCSFMPVRMGQWLSDDAITAMFRHAMDNGADVISCSWSAAGWNFPLSTRISAILEHVATQGRDGKGCVVLFAAGNEDRPLDGEKDGARSVQGFALHPSVVAVAASNSLDQRSNYSNFGREIAIAAPSSGSPGRRVVTTDRVGGSGYGPGDETYDFGGTSSATPLAAGLAALILSVNPSLTARAVKQLMIDTAAKIDADNARYDQAGHSIFLGHGRIDAEAAVRRALGRDVGAERTLAMEHRVGKAVLDMQPTSDSIIFPVDVAATAIEVSLEVRHTWIGDLRITLRSPAGAEVVLHDRSGAGQDDLIRTYRSGGADRQLDPLLAAPPKGAWQLLVADNAPADEGALVKWGIAISYRA